MKTIVWDVDDVLNDLMQAWLEQAWRPLHPGCDVEYAALRENPPHRVLGIDAAEYFSSLDEFRRSPAALSLTPNREILSWLQSYGDAYRHVALTARPLGSTPHAADWLFRHFGDHFRCFGVVPSRPRPGTPVYDRSKRDFLAWLGGVDFMVDDSPQNISGAEALGIRAFLYPQPWNDGRHSVTDILGALTSEVVVA